MSSSSGDHISVGMSIDLTPFSQAITKAKAGLKDFAEHSSEHMDKSAMSGRRLHSILNEISRISPVAGLAIAGAFSLPMLGAELLMEGLKAIKEHFDEIKKSAEESRKAMADVMKIQNESFIESQSGGGSMAVYAVHQEVEQSQKKMDAIRKRITEAAEATEKAQQKFDFRKAQSTPGVLAASAIADPAHFIDPLVRKADYDKAADALDKAVKNEQRLREELEAEMKDQIERKNFLRETDQFEKEAAKNADERIEQRKKEVAISERINELFEEESKAEDERARKRKAYAAEALSLEAKIAELSMAPFRPSLRELAGSGGPNGNLASRIEQLQSLGKRANMAGNSGLLDSVKRQLYGYDYDPDASRAAGGIAQRDIHGNTMSIAHRSGLMDQLRATGIMAPEQHAKEMNDKLAELLQLASGRGLNINTPD